MSNISCKKSSHSCFSNDIQCNEVDIRSLSWKPDPLSHSWLSDSYYLEPIKANQKYCWGCHVTRKKPEKNTTQLSHGGHIWPRLCFLSLCDFRLVETCWNMPGLRWGSRWTALGQWHDKQPPAMHIARVSEQEPETSERVSSKRWKNWGRIKMLICCLIRLVPPPPNTHGFCSSCLILAMRSTISCEVKKTECKADYVFNKITMNEACQGGPAGTTCWESRRWSILWVVVLSTSQTLYDTCRKPL